MYSESFFIEGRFIEGSCVSAPLIDGPILLLQPSIYTHRQQNLTSGTVTGCKGGLVVSGAEIGPINLFDNKFPYNCVSSSVF